MMRHKKNKKGNMPKLFWKIRHKIRYIISRRYRKSIQAWEWFSKLTDSKKSENMRLLNDFLGGKL